MNKGMLKLRSVQPPTHQLTTLVSLPQCFVTFPHPILKSWSALAPAVLPPSFIPKFARNFCTQVFLSWPSGHMSLGDNRTILLNKPAPATHSSVPSLLRCSSLLLETHMTFSQSEISVTCQIKSELLLRLSMSLTI